jgi:hypothetical protein
MVRIDGPIFEYACHEGNYGMAGIFRGARAEEQAVEGAATGDDGNYEFGIVPNSR